MSVRVGVAEEHKAAAIQEIKAVMKRNVFFDSVQETRKAVQGFIRFINETPAATVERLCLQF